MFWSRFKKHEMVPVGDLRFEQACILRTRKGGSR